MYWSSICFCVCLFCFCEVFGILSGSLSIMLNHCTECQGVLAAWQDVWWWQGVLRKGQEIEIRPGIVTKDAEGRVACIPIYSRIITLLAEQNDLQYAVPGGLIGVGTTVRLLGRPAMWSK